MMKLWLMTVNARFYDFIDEFLVRATTKEDARTRAIETCFKRRGAIPDSVQAVELPLDGEEGVILASFENK